MLRRITRRAALALPYIARAVAATPNVDPRIAEFHQHWDKFLRVYLGCPSWATQIRECDLNQGLWDIPEFRKAAKAAKELFDLKGK